MRQFAKESDKCQLSETLCFGVLEGADDDGQTHFAHGCLIGTRQRHVEIRFWPLFQGAESEGRDQGRETRVDQRSEVNKEKDGKIYLQARPKTDFDVTSSGANEATMGKMSLPIVISSLENPKTQSFRELTFLNCARLFRICSILSQTASYAHFAHLSEISMQ
ncbi:hypothetical protein PRIPAC_81166 [Pristionchus pacificus]|uniref:Uncharacterized protein n=1 Tax=Pristionchus pacificus TaxID=54126 RepID=A0A2A6C520_PRIPA|nr:hypothetical protein PRIPAC_81166 [Pristionchus pacificus]|eukprot:PDM73143.1 hypothetical protein PRIPAC_39577 [Pristionchus pacificus]